MDEHEVAPLSRTLRVGEAMVLLVAVVVGLVVVDQRQQGRYEMLSSEVSSVSVGSFDGGSGSADPQLCWLLGVVADAEGRGAEVASQALSGAGDPCAAAAAQGANGQPLTLP